MPHQRCIILLEDSGVDQLSGGIEAIDWFGISLL